MGVLTLQSVDWRCMSVFKCLDIFSACYSGPLETAQLEPHAPRALLRALNVFWPLMLREGISAPSYRLQRALPNWHRSGN